MSASKSRGGRSPLVFIFFCHAVSVLLFCRGFMLKRVVVPEYSKCVHPPDTAAAAVPLPSCYSYPRPFKRVLWLLIDALRYDFTVYDDTLDSPPIYRNKMPYIRELLETQPANARLFKFVADPPTTTMQRLKALTTGSLPTFVDIGSNFNSYAVSEDSLPYQAKLNSRNVTFIGDDTWLGLYPDMMTKTFDYPSLNVQDLDTVDDGVMERLGPELAKYDAEIVIGHMLGVDHVGHTYGPSHWTMGKKLTQMNDFIRELLELWLLDQDTLVFVFGDHGMSPTGDHGGETSLETNAALLVYSPKPLFDPLEPAMGREVYQIDLVPTTAMAVGLPIPFSNLGTVIPEVLLPFVERNRVGGGGSRANGYTGRVTPEFLEALRINAEQLHKYLETYAQYSQDFPVETFSRLEKNFNHVLGVHQEILQRSTAASQRELTHIAGQYFAYSREVKLMCQSIWAKFDQLLMYQGLALLLLAVLAMPLMLLDVEKSAASLCLAVPSGLKIGLGLTVISLVFTGIDVSLFGTVILLGNFALASLLATLFGLVWKLRGVVTKKLSLMANHFLSILFKVRFLSLLSLTVVLLHAVSMLSNSFILYEADMLAFFIQSLIFVLALKRVQRVLSSCDAPRQGSSLLLLLVRSVLPHVMLMACVRLSKLFYACRDLQLQDGCETTTFILSFASAREFLGIPLSILRLAASAVGLYAVVMALMAYLWKRDVFLNRHFVVGYKVGFMVCVTCVVVHWGLHTLPETTLRSLSYWQHVAAPRVVYLVSTALLVLCVLCPLKKRQHLPITTTSSCEDPTGEDHPVTTTITASHLGGSGAPRQRSKMRDWSGSLATASPSPGLSLPTSSTTAATSSGKASSVAVPVTAVLVTSLWIPVAMLMNDGIALSVVLTALQAALALTVLRLSSSEEEGISWEGCVLWALLGSHSFFSFGHHATVTSLRFEAGFVGIHGEITKYNLPLAATLVGLNTIASQLLFGLGFPLLLVASGGSNERGLEPSQQLLSPMLFYCGLHSVKLLVTMLAATLHRRHLMVWWVFAPRFLYEGAFQATTDITIVLASWFVGRLGDTVARQVRT